MLKEMKNLYIEEGETSLTVNVLCNRIISFGVYDKMNPMSTTKESVLFEIDSILPWMEKVYKQITNSNDDFISSYIAERDNNGELEYGGVCINRRLDECYIRFLIPKSKHELRKQDDLTTGLRWTFPSDANMSQSFKLGTATKAITYLTRLRRGVSEWQEQTNGYQRRSMQLQDTSPTTVRMRGRRLPSNVSDQL